MYVEYYGLREKPFELVPDPRYLYLTWLYKEALAALTYGIKAQKGFLLLSGQPGSGKTTVLRHLLRVLPSHLRTAFIFNTELTYEEFLRAFLRELSLPHETASREDMVLALNGYLLAEYKAGRSVLLIIDEAQNLSSAVLENIRMLSNLETDRGKPLQILLAGQPDLWNKVNQPPLQQLGQRVTVVCHLDRLTPRETAEYITHRLRVAGGDARQLFTQAALRQVHHQAMGNPRLINVICDEALLFGFVKEEPHITSRMIRRGVRMRRVPRQGSSGNRRYVWNALVMLIVVAMLLMAFTLARKTVLPGFAPRVMELLRQQNASNELPPGEVQREQTPRLDRGQVAMDSEAPPEAPQQDAPKVLGPIVRWLMEDSSKPVALQEPAPAEPRVLQVTKETVTPSSAIDVWHEVRPGETLAAVAMAQYRRSDPMILNLIKRHNPSIEDINRIAPGLRLGLPPLTASAWVRTVDNGGFAALVLTTPSAWEANRAVWSLSQEGVRATTEAIRVSARAEWFEVLVIGLSSADEAARLGAIYQRR